MMLSMITMASPLGTLRLYADGDELTAVSLPCDAAAVANECSTPVLDLARAQLTEYFAGTRRAFELPLAPRGTGFQQIVWRALTTIRYGETWSYGQLARVIGRPAASRAVGAANGRNPLAIIVPCHRVIGANGTLTGYAGGLPAKKWLLQHEVAHGGHAAIGTLFASC
ncbi:MAG TPA: methylated-DNA--[protein]-cysteine S-methyltransferase [Kofleriaceae bacterium]|nr:methylated-DNA--[protein]-cysteine S-methyltransferase [Kofleriaceae bacterium]